MRNVKKIFSVLLATVMIFGLVSCGKSTNNSSGEASSNDVTSTEKVTYDKVVYAYATFNNIPSSEVLNTVEEAINQITREKIGVEVELMPIGIADYSSTVSLSLQGGDQIDVFESLGDFNTSVSSGMAYDLTDIIDTCAAETKATLSEDILASCIQNERLYGIPTYKPYALTPMVIYKQEIADELGIDMSQVKSVEDLTDVLRSVKTAYPDMTPVVPAQSGNPNMVLLVSDQIDYLTDDYYSPKGVLMDDSLVVADLYNTTKFEDICDLMRVWYEENLILQDAATTTSTASELMSSDNTFCYVASYSYPPEDTAASLEAQCGGNKLGAVQIGDAYLDTTSINALSWMVASNSKVAESALKFINLTFTDQDIINLLIYGIKDRDYVLDADGYASYPEGKDAASVDYTAQLSCGTLGNYFLMYPMSGTSKDSLVWEEEQNQLAAKSPAMGFTFDSSSVKTEYTAVSNVIQQYLPSLLCGSVDPDTVLPEFRDRLETAGLGAIISEKQKQLDNWATGVIGE